MQIRSIKTRKITPQACTLYELLDESIDTLEEGSIVVVTSKIVSLCEGSVVPMEGTDKDELIAQHSSQYLPRSASQYNVTFAITDSHLAPGAGIDESNGDGYYVLWPKDAQASANAIRVYLCQK